MSVVVNASAFAGRARSRFSALICAAALAALLAPQANGESRSTAQGVYSAEQAQKGLEVHEEYCAKCHHYSYFQGSFLLAWQNQPVSALYDLIKLKMPEDRPGSLKPREYAALLAYVFELNELPAGGDKLGHEHEEMSQILIKSE